MARGSKITSFKKKQKLINDLILDKNKLNLPAIHLWDLKPKAQVSSYVNCHNDNASNDNYFSLLGFIINEFSMSCIIIM